MKKVPIIFAVLLSIILTGCGPTAQYIERVDFLDYSEYSKEGFFITESNSVSFDYIPLGSIAVYMYAGEGGNWYLVNGVMRYKSNSLPYPGRALELAVSESKRIGGNAIINLKISPSTINLIGVDQSGFILTGMTVKK